MTDTASTAQSGSTAVPAPQVWPTLRATNARALIRFLVEAFGFVEVVAWGDQPDGSGDVVVHAQLSWPLGGGVMLGSDREEADGGGWPLRPGTFGCYVVCDDPDTLFARATGAGAVVHQPLSDTDYGSREFAVRDPEGNLWSFGTYRGEPRRT
jgi:uncharacterized glyoxalase superfamily protein PhnB